MGPSCKAPYCSKNSLESRGRGVLARATPRAVPGRSVAVPVILVPYLVVVAGRPVDKAAVVTTVAHPIPPAPEAAEETGVGAGRVQKMGRAETAPRVTRLGHRRAQRPRPPRDPVAVRDTEEPRVPASRGPRRQNPAVIQEDTAPPLIVAEGRRVCPKMGGRATDIG